jgi:DnaJ C terminal domain
MAFQQPPGGDIRATLSITQTEATSGTSRMLNLPGGRQVTVAIPSGVRDGQEIRMPGQGMPAWNGGPSGALILTIAIAPAEYFSSQSYTAGGTDYPTDYMAPPPPPISSTAPNYVSAGSGSAYTKYPTTGPEAGNIYQAQAAYPQYAGPRQPSQPGFEPSTGPKPKKPGISTGVLVLLIVLVLLLIGGGVLFAYVGVIQPNQQHVQATATAQALNTQATGTAQANANATAAVQATGTAQAAATTTALQGIYTQVTSGNPALNDPLSGQDGNNWDVGSANGQGSCKFSGNAYHAGAQQSNYFYACFAETPTFSNLAYQVQMTIIQGDYGGIIFHADSTNSKYYYYRIGKDGAYDLTVSTDTSFAHDRLLKSGNASSIIKTGLNQPNLVAVVAKGSDLYLFVNQQYLDKVSDSTYKSGQIGIFGGNFTSTSADVAFTNAKVWTL